MTVSSSASLRASIVVACGFSWSVARGAPCVKDWRCVQLLICQLHIVAWCVCMVRLHGAFAWCVCMVRLHGVFAWCVCMGRFHAALNLENIKEALGLGHVRNDKSWDGWNFTVSTLQGMQRMLDLLIVMRAKLQSKLS
eukprot:349855-Chlamydomonas_euryale.AAC.13